MYVEADSPAADVFVALLVLLGVVIAPVVVVWAG